MTSTTEGHFSLEEWADFVRGQVNPETRARMQRHLDEGCRMCAKIVELWQSVLDLARRAKTFQPLDSDVRWAHVLFRVFPPAEAAGVDLLFGFLNRHMPRALEGVRGAGTSLGHFIFQKENLLLDLQFRVTGESASMLGQLLDSADQGASYSYTTVKVMSESGMEVETTTNEFGEFRLQYHLQPNLLLVIELESANRLVTPLPHPSEI